MKYGVNTLLWTASFDAGHLDLLPKIKAGGFDGVEISRFSFDNFPAAAIRRALEANQLEHTFCSALTGDLSLANGDDRAVSFLKDAIHCARDLGASILAGPFCAPVGYLPGRRRTSDEWKQVIDGLNALTPALDESGVTLAVEPLNRFETYFLNTMEDARALCDAVNHPGVGVLFDTFHANIEEKSIQSSLRSIGPHLKHVHACENDRGIPGSGHVAWGELRDELRARDYDGWVVIESFGFAIREIAAAACIWRDLASTPDAIAFDGLTFLRGLMAGHGPAPHVQQCCH
jgi:D-psicose/D-tagatose/L-ribulose 3-epimerase